MAWLRAFGSYLPARVMTNADLAPLVGGAPEWILDVSGIEERRIAAEEETVALLGAEAAKDCLARAGMEAHSVGLLLVSSGSAERRFPGPAASIGAMLGINGVPAIDLPVASAGSIFALSLASQLAGSYGSVLVVASEIMSRAVRMQPESRDTAILFGDGAGACLVSGASGFARLADSRLASDGEFADILKLDFDSPLAMNGRAVILQASRKLPRIILEVLERNQVEPEAVGVFLMHQANVNLINRVAAAVGVPEARFFRNMARYGNTSSASMLIAAADWHGQGGTFDSHVVFAGFGAGLHWGAALAVKA
jgi:3-oxoacyl-[acyl-carrier-protein] synthase III